MEKHNNDDSTFSDSMDNKIELPRVFVFAVNYCLLFRYDLLFLCRSHFSVVSAILSNCDLRNNK